VNFVDDIEGTMYLWFKGYSSRLNDAGHPELGVLTKQVD